MVIDKLDAHYGFLPPKKLLQLAETPTFFFACKSLFFAKVFLEK